MFTKRYYKAIAKIVKNTIYNKGWSEYDKRERKFVSNLADYFAKDNPRFDRNKFLKACGLED